MQQFKVFHVSKERFSKWRRMQYLKNSEGFINHRFGSFFYLKPFLLRCPQKFKNLRDLEPLTFKEDVLGEQAALIIIFYHNNLGGIRNCLIYTCAVDYWDSFGT